MRSTIGRADNRSMSLAGAIAAVLCCAPSGMTAAGRQQQSASYIGVLDLAIADTALTYLQPLSRNQPSMESALKASRSRDRCREMTEELSTLCQAGHQNFVRVS